MLRPMRVSIEIDPVAPCVALGRWGYPHAEWRNTDVLNKCLVFRIARALSSDPVAYVWFHWETPGSSTAKFHACADPKYRGRWVSPKVINDLLKAVWLMGAEGVVATPDTESHGRVLERLGFTRDGPRYTLTLPEDF